MDIVMKVAKRSYVSNSDWIVRVKELLTKNRYMTAKDISDAFRVSENTVRRVIRQMRLNGIGVLATNRGYTLSEYATQSDDLYFIRWCFGRRMNEQITLIAARKDIIARWTREEDQKAMQSLLGSIDTGTKATERGIKLLQSDHLLSIRGGL